MSVECLDSSGNESDDKEKSFNNAAAPTTPKGSTNLNKSKTSAGKSTEKLDKNLRLQIKLEHEKKRKEEKVFLFYFLDLICNVLMVAF